MRSRQEVFTEAYRGLRAQKWERSLSRVAAWCAYNGRGGRHCAIGWAFSVPSRLEGYPVMSLPKDVISEEDGNSLGYEFLSGLQHAHDDGKSVEEMQRNLVAFAAEYGLEIPPDDGQDPVLAP